MDDRLKITLMAKPTAEMFKPMKTNHAVTHLHVNYKPEPSSKQKQRQKHGTEFPYPEEIGTILSSVLSLSSPSNPLCSSPSPFHWDEVDISSSLGPEARRLDTTHIAAG